MERLAVRVRRGALCVSRGAYDMAGDGLLFEELDDWADEVSSQTLAGFAEQIDALRNVASEGQGPAPEGEWIVHLWGRSIGTGEAEVASRGFFDIWDRPPRRLWMEVFARPRPRGAAGEEIALLAFVPLADLERARLGRQADPNASLWTLSEISPALSAQLAPLIAP